MLNPDASQPANGSGAALSQPIESTASGDNDASSTPPMTQPEKGSAPTSPESAQCHPPFNYHAARHLAASQMLPSLQVGSDLASDDHVMTSARELDPFVHHSRSSGSLPRRTPSFRTLGRGSNSSAEPPSPGSILPSPQLVAMGDITPLPSPINGLSSWKLSRVDSQSLSRTSSTGSRPGSSLGLRLSESNQMLAPARSRSRSKQYPGLDKLGEEPPESSSASRRDAPLRHARNRSLSEYVPPARSVLVKPRPVVVSGTGAEGGIASSSSTDSKSADLHREQYLAVHRGIASTAPRPPTPPRSSQGDDGDSDHEPVINHSQIDGPPSEFYSVRSVQTQQPRKYRKIRQLGQGTFSQVTLAVRVEQGAENGTGDISNHAVAGATQRLVAIKIVEHGPAGGADEERLEVSLKREVDVLRSVNHPSLVQLKAFGSDDKRALLVLDYCPGGDLFDIASSNPKPMRPELTRRIFAELVSAVRYLHEDFIVHRDIKLESELASSLSC